VPSGETSRINNAGRHVYIIVCVCVCVCVCNTYTCIEREIERERREREREEEGGGEKRDSSVVVVFITHVIHVVNGGHWVPPARGTERVTERETERQIERGTYEQYLTRTHRIRVCTCAHARTQTYAGVSNLIGGAEWSQEGEVNV
jgi:hypothetical protein